MTLDANWPLTAITGSERKCLNGDLNLFQPPALITIPQLLILKILVSELVFFLRNIFIYLGTNQKFI